RRAEGVLREPLVDHLADHLAPLGAILRKPRPGEEHAGRERRPRAHDDRVLRRREHGLAHGTERVLGAFTPGRSEDDRVVIGELVGDDLDGIARARAAALPALVVGTPAERREEGRTAARAVAAGDGEEGDRGGAEVGGQLERLRLWLGRRQGDVLGHLDHGGEDDVVLAGEGEAGLDDRAVTVDVGDGDEGLHGRPASTTGATRSAITRGHASARAPERSRAAGVSSTPTTASAMTSPEASAGT